MLNRQNNCTHIVFGLIACATLIVSVIAFRFAFANNFREFSVIGKPRFAIFVDHCREGNATRSGGRCHPHDLNFILLQFIGFSDRINTFAAEFGQRIVEQLETTHTLWIGECQTS